ncbi:site-specific integrase [Bifidobacterium subtile]|jgi:integrase|uniref:tyrosine-type recombinase/integrase n=1 Tax=Bifidobacterium subtile TaxID=77635 RepID=UPI002F356ABB
MARAWIVDRWLKDAKRGGVRVPPSAAVKRAVAAGAPMSAKTLAKVPEEHRTAVYGKGMRWRVNWYETSGDGTKKLRAKNFELKSEAEAEQAALEDDIRAGRYIDSDTASMTFGEAKTKWRNSLHDDKGSSLWQYDSLMRMYVMPRWANVRLSSITKDAIDSWIGQLKEGKAPYDFNTERTPSKPSRKYLHQIISVAFGTVLRYAVRQGWLLTNPMQDMTLKRTDPQRAVRNKVYLSHEEVSALANAAAMLKAGSQTDSTIITFMSYTGLRLGETFALKVGDINLDKRRVTVDKTITKTEEGKPSEGPTKTGEARKVPIPGFVIDLLRPLVEGRGLDEYLFTSRRGLPLNPHNWRNRIFSPAKEGAGLGDVEGLRPHSLRHTYASLSILAGCDVVTLANALGHRDVKMTLNEYADLWPDRLDEVADALEKARASSAIMSNHVPDTDAEVMKSPRNLNDSKG